MTLDRMGPEPRALSSTAHRAGPGFNNTAATCKYKNMNIECRLCYANVPFLIYNVPQIANTPCTSHVKYRVRSHSCIMHYRAIHFFLFWLQAFYKQIMGIHILTTSIGTFILNPKIFTPIFFDVWRRTNYSSENFTIIKATTWRQMTFITVENINYNTREEENT